MLEPIQALKKVPTYSGIRHNCKRNRIVCNLNLCRKVFASWLIQSGIDSNTVDMLSGRCPQSVLIRHYQTPSHDLKDRVIAAITKLDEGLKR
jgi:intergrase/recombinase